MARGKVFSVNRLIKLVDIYFTFLNKASESALPFNLNFHFFLKV
ncbi:hypothetical protein FHW88_005119 [Mucilaginibacter sp. SG538B]|nr:hypothetical protein [Mucilaginibacter sp. SG538B]